MNAIQELYTAKTEKLYSFEDLQRAFEEGVRVGKREFLAKEARRRVDEDRVNKQATGVRMWNDIPNWKQLQIVSRMKKEFESML